VRHLKVEDVVYVTRPLTLFETSLWNILIGVKNRGGLTAEHPQYYQLWVQFLWSRQDEALPQELFADILLPDFQDHVDECLGQYLTNSTARILLEANWNKFTPGVEPSQFTIREALKDWKGRLDA
jgi:hypothetical protein